MTQLAAQAAGTSSFNETAIRSTLRAIADRARATPDEISGAIAAGWTQGVKHAMSDGALSAEEANLRYFRDRMADQDLPSVITSSTILDRASAARITAQARRAALGHGGALQELENTLRRTSMSTTHRRQLLIRAWEEAVEGALEDGLISLDEDHALCQYMKHFDISEQDLNANGALTTMVQAAVIRAEPKPARKARSFPRPEHRGCGNQGFRLTTPPGPPRRSIAPGRRRGIPGRNTPQLPPRDPDVHIRPVSGNLTRFPGNPVVVASRERPGPSLIQHTPRPQRRRPDIST